MTVTTSDVHSSARNAEEGQARLAGFISSIQLADIPESVRQRLKHCLIDFFAVSLYASRASTDFVSSMTALEAVAGRGSAPCSIVGSTRRTSVELAALANALLGHSFDFDDTNVAGFFHPGVVVIPPTLAYGQHRHVDGNTLLRAMVAGYEVGARVGAALGESAYDRGFHVTPVAGVFGGTAGAAIVEGFDARRLDQAWGFAQSQAAGSMQYLADGAWNKRFQPGFASRAAVDSVALISAGVLGATGSIEGRWGLLQGYTDAPSPGWLTRELGDRWLTLETGIKPYPSCRFTHGAIDAALELRRHIDGVQLESDPSLTLEVQISPRADVIVGGNADNKVAPQTMVDGQFSVYFQVAAALAHGTVSPDVYDDVTSQQLQRIIDRIRVEPDSGLHPLGARLSVRDADGQLLHRAVCELPAGEPPDGVTEQLVVDKFQQLASPVLGGSAGDVLLTRILELEGLEHVDDLFVPNLGA